MSCRIILVGAGPFVLPVFEKINNSSIEIAAVVTQADAPKNRGKKMQAQELAIAAEAAGLPCLKPSDINTQVEKLKSFSADLLLTASYGQFVKRATRNAFPHKSFNLHPSALPLYRGATPVNATLKDGHKNTAVTLYQMESQMDAGPIAAQVSTPIHNNECADALLLRLAALAGDLAVEYLPQIVAGHIQLTEQDHNKASFCHKLSKSDALIDWHLSAQQIHNRLRAHHPWPGSQSHINDSRLSFFDSEIISDQIIADVSPGEIIEVSKQGVLVNCQKGQILFKSFQLPGKKKLDAAAFLNGCKLSVGEKFS